VAPIHRGHPQRDPLAGTVGRVSGTHIRDVHYFPSGKPGFPNQSARPIRIFPPHLIELDQFSLHQLTPALKSTFSMYEDNEEAFISKPQNRSQLLRI
jgi:hypothetical protein